MLVSRLSENGLECVVFKDITGEPTDVMIDEGLKAYRENNCDFLIGTAAAADNDCIAANKFISGLLDICRQCEVPTITDYGIDTDKFTSAIPKMTSDALASESPANTRKNVSEYDIAAIYKALI